MKMLFLFLFLVAAGCKPAEESKTSGARGFTYNKPGGAPVGATAGTSFTLTSPASSPDYQNSVTFSVNGVVAGDTVRIFSNSNCSTLISSAVAAGTSLSFTVNSLSVGTHTFYTNSSNALTTSSCSSASLSYNYLGVFPTLATSISLSSPASSPGTDSTPTFLLSGVVSGETVKIFSDSACTVLQGSAVAAGTTVLVTSSALAPGVYTFYTRTTNAAASTACGAISENYEYLGVVPNTAASIVLKTPATSPNYSATPKFTASGGVVNGDTVKLFTDGTCTTEVGSATSTGINVDITIAALGSSGVYTFYTRSTNVAGTSACSAARATYNYLGASPVVQVSWTANKEKAVNQAGGGYIVYYSTVSNFDTSTASHVDVPYVAGPSTPVTTTISNLLVGTYYFKVVAFSALNAYGATGGTVSSPSSEFSVTLP